jgi:serine/threonine protein kinase
MAQHIRERGRLEALQVVRELRRRKCVELRPRARRDPPRHQDENILIDRHTGRAMVTDFGIARLAESAHLDRPALGTVLLPEPEQVSGDKVDARSDIYSLEVVGYFALSGRFPIDADLASAVLIAHVTKQPPPLLSAALTYRVRSPSWWTDVSPKIRARDFPIVVRSPPAWRYRRIERAREPRL